MSDAPKHDHEAPLILIVEDDIDIRLFISLGLSENYQVVEAVNGKDGLEKAREYVPDLVVTDLMMPVLDGIALCRELKTRPESSHIPVVMLTSKTSVESQLEGLQIGADDYITKPFNMILLEARIANLLESRRQLREQFSRQFIPGGYTPFLENSTDREFLDKAVDAVEQHYADWDFKAEEFAASLNMSLRTLQRKLKAVADRNPTGFVNEFRMTKAAGLLLSTSLTVTEIAFQVGCDESSNFARLFRKHFKMSPSSYRAANSAG